MPDVDLDWQLEIDGAPVRGGRVLNIVDRWQNKQSVFLLLRESENGLQQQFAVRYNVNIGGKDYLILQAASDENGQLTPARVLTRQTLSAMDVDRFSSLRNAMQTYLETAASATPEELSKVLGDFPER